MSWGAVAVAGATVYASYQSSKAQQSAQESANQANIEMTKEGIAEKKRQFDISQPESTRRFDVGMTEATRQFDVGQGRIDAMRSRLDPYSQAGETALTEQQALLGLSGSAAQKQAYQQVTESPGQEFLRQRQERSLLRNQAAIGGLGGGNVRTALQEQAFGRAQTDIDRRVERLGGLTSQGLQASGRV